MPVGEGRRRKNAAATRGDILEAARTAFTQRGYDGVGLRDIAAAAAVHAALVNRYFGSKEALFAEAVADAFSIKDMIGGDRNSLGESLARHVLTKPKTPDGFDPILAMLRSAPNPRAAALMRDALEQRFVMPLAEWLGGTDAGQRACLIAAALAGLTVMRDLIGLAPLLSDVDAVARSEGCLLQQLIDGGQPPTSFEDTSAIG